MDSQTDLNHQKKEEDFLQTMFQNDIVWLINGHENPEEGEEMRPFDSIQSRSLERKLTEFTLDPIN